MNLRAILVFGCLSAVALLQAGCGGSATTRPSDAGAGDWDAGDRPQMRFAGANRSEVMALAMGAARSRAWTIVDVKDDRFVAQRPLDSSSAITNGGAPAGSVMEVTSYVVEDRAGVLVALDATLVSPAIGSTEPTRVDATESVRPALTESLESLHATWAKNRSRVARAAPPAGGAAPAGGSGATGAAPARGPVSAAEPTPETRSVTATPVVADSNRDVPVSDGGSAAVASATAADRPVPSMPAESRPTIAAAPVAAVPAAGPDPATPSSRLASPAPAPSQTPTGPPRPEPRRPVGSPAPVVDAGAYLRPGSGAASRPMSLPPAPPEPTVDPPAVSPGDNMMALYPSSVDTGPAYYAEQYARLRGCNVGSEGAILIDSRSDGEIHKVPCNGTDSILVQCRGGDCRGLL